MSAYAEHDYETIDDSDPDYEEPTARAPPSKRVAAPRAAKAPAQPRAPAKAPAQPQPAQPQPFYQPQFYQPQPSTSAQFPVAAAYVPPAAAASPLQPARAPIPAPSRDPYKCSGCGKLGTNITHCGCVAREVQRDRDTAALFDSGQFVGTVTVDGLLMGEALKFTAVLTQERLKVNSSSLDKHVLEGLKVRVDAATEQINKRRSAAQEKLAAKRDELQAKKRKREAEEKQREADEYQELQELEREAALAANVGDPTAPKPASGWFGWARGAE